MKRLSTICGFAFGLIISGQSLACELESEYKLPKGVQWGELCEFSENLAVVQKAGKYGFVNNKGIIEIPLIYGFAAPFSETFATVEKNDKWGFIDHKNNWWCSKKYAVIRCSHN